MSDSVDGRRRTVLSRFRFGAYLLARLPLAAAAGVRVRSLDASSCTVSIPGGWRTRNPFRSTYFAAQAMAAEMSTGAPAMLLADETGGSVAFIVRELRAVFTKRIQGEATFTFDDVAGMRAAVERAAAGTESESYVGRSIGRTADGTIASEFEITWSFKRRARARIES